MGEIWKGQVSDLLQYFGKQGENKFHFGKQGKLYVQENADVMQEKTQSFVHFIFQFEFVF